MGFLVKLVVSAIAVIISAYILPGVYISGIGAALILALVLALLNAVVRPVLVLFTFPITILTLGIFLLVINAVIILLADFIMGRSFGVDGFLYALIFSLVLSVISAILDAIFGVGD